MAEFLSTPAAAQLLGISERRLRYLGDLLAPGPDRVGRNIVWSPEDVDRARDLHALVMVRRRDARRFTS